MKTRTVFPMRALLGASMASALLAATLPAQAQHRHPPATAPAPLSSTEAATSRTPIPPITDADRAAATRPLEATHAHDDGIHSLVVVNRLETWRDDGTDGQRWEAKAWLGGDIDRVWVRTEGERIGGRVEAADIEVLYGHSVGPWWDVVAGIRRDTGAAGSRTWAAIGIQGLAPQKFEVAATGYAADDGRTAARIEIERDIPLSRRWILQPTIEVDLHGRNDRSRGIGAGLSRIESGLRLRYEIARRFAPYLGIVHEQRYGNTAAWNPPDEPDADTRWVAGVRLWF